MKKNKIFSGRKPPRSNKPPLFERLRKQAVKDVAKQYEKLKNEGVLPYSSLKDVNLNELKSMSLTSLNDLRNKATYKVSNARRLLKKTAYNIIKSSSATQGSVAHERYTAIMDLIPANERDNARETYASDEIFEIGGYMVDDHKNFEAAAAYYNEKVARELDELLKDI